MNSYGPMMCSFPGCENDVRGTVFIVKNGLTLDTCGRHEEDEWKSYITRLKNAQKV